MGFLKYIKILYILKYLLGSHIHKDDKGHKKSHPGNKFEFCILMPSSSAFQC